MLGMYNGGEDDDPRAEWKTRSHPRLEQRNSRSRLEVANDDEHYLVDQRIDQLGLSLCGAQSFGSQLSEVVLRIGDSAFYFVGAHPVLPSLVKMVRESLVRLEILLAFDAKVDVVALLALLLHRALHLGDGSVRVYASKSLIDMAAKEAFRASMSF
jgi:hypothetical protein